MRVICNQHERGIGIHVSPDLVEQLRAGAPFPRCQEFTYTYDGSPYLRIVMSRDFAQQAGIQALAAALPEDYPDWFTQLVPACMDCIDEALAATIRTD